MDFIFPIRLIAGLPLDYLVPPLTAYPASGGWSLRAVIRGPSSIDLDSTADGDQHRFTRTLEQTTPWLPGKHHCSLRAMRGADTVELEFRPVEIVQDLALLPAGTDARSHNEIVLANVQAVMEKRATQDQERYKINNRELWRTPLSELLKLEAIYLARVRREKAREAGGSAWGRQVRVRFTSPK